MSFTLTKQGNYVDWALFSALHTLTKMKTARHRHPCAHPPYPQSHGHMMPWELTWQYTLGQAHDRYWQQE